MKTLVIGANGQIGRQFCELAHEADVPIRAMIRDTSQQAWFQERGIETVLADLEGDFRKAFYGCDQVVFAAGSGPHTGPDKTLMIDLYGALSAIDLAASLGIGRFIMSARCAPTKCLRHRPSYALTWPPSMPPMLICVHRRCLT